MSCEIRYIELKLTELWEDPGGEVLGEKLEIREGVTDRLTWEAEHA